MTKTMLGIAVATAATAAGAVKGYQLLGKRYGHLLPQAERYLIPEGTQSVTVHTGIGDFRLVAASGYYGRTGIFVYAENLVDPDAFMHQPRATYALAGLEEPKVPQVTPELSAAFLEATDGQFHLDLPPHTSSGGDGRAFALITAGANEDNYRYPVTVIGLKHGKGYFKCDHAPTMRMAARTLRVIIDGPPSVRIRSDLRFIAEGSRPEHTLHDLRKAKATTAELTRYYKKLAISGYQAVQTRVAEHKSKN